MLNEFDTKGLRSNHFEAHKKAVESLSIVDIVKAIDYINELSRFIPQENEVLDYLEDVVEPLVKVQNILLTNKECPHCGFYLFQSDLPQYDYVCAECDENFYESEVK